MQLVERHLVRQDHPEYASIDAAAFASKNLYNQANYQIRQAFIHEGKYLPYAEIFHRIKHMDCYQALPRSPIPSRSCSTRTGSPFLQHAKPTKRIPRYSPDARSCRSTRTR